MTRSLLVYSMGEVIGDGLIKLPVLAGVRAAFPAARISWCAAKGSTVYAGPLAPVVAGLIDEVVTDAPTGAGAWDWLTAWRPFGGRRFEVVIDTQENVRRSLVARRAAERLFVSGAAGGRLSQAPLTGDAPLAVVDRLLRLASAAAGRPVVAAPVPIADPRALAAAESLLPSGPTYVGLAPGAGGADRRWPLVFYLELARRQAAKGRTPVVFMGPQEQAEIAEVRAELPFALLPEVNRTDAHPEVRGPLLAIALAGRLSAAVANDAGPGHMLAAGGAPLVSLARDARLAAKFRPAAVRLTQLVAGGDMAALSVDAVEWALDALLES